MIPIVSIVGKSNTGKTTLSEKLIQELKQRGYRVATVKHVARELEMDRPGKDSWRLARAGADAVWVSGPEGLHMHKPVQRDLKLEELPAHIGAGFDLILAEGFKESPVPKIEVHRKVIGGNLLFSPAQLLAVVTDEPLEVEAPLFSWDEVGALADLIEAEFLSARPMEAEVTLFVDEQPIDLNPFMVSILTRVVSAMVSVLRGVGEIRAVSLHIKKNTEIKGPE